MSASAVIEHRLLRVDSPKPGAQALSQAAGSPVRHQGVCSCGAWAWVFSRDAARVWMGLHRRHPEADPAELAARYGAEQSSAGAA